MRSRTQAESLEQGRRKRLGEVKERSKELKATFAERLSEDTKTRRVTVTDIAKSLGLTQQRGSQIMKEIKADLGWLG